MREYCSSSRYRLVPYTTVCNSLSSAGTRQVPAMFAPTYLRHTLVTRALTAATLSPLPRRLNASRRGLIRDPNDDHRLVVFLHTDPGKSIDCVE